MTKLDEKKQKNRDQSANPHSLISPFCIFAHCKLYYLSLIHTEFHCSRDLVSVAEQTGLSPAWSQTPKTGSKVIKHFYVQLN